MIDIIQKTELLKLAQDATKKSYAPYSKFKVGAALITDSGEYFQGCNIENASYGLTICAERAAICNAIINEGSGKMGIKAIAVVNDRDLPCSPCGSCRQFIYEFGRHAMVIFKGEKDIEDVSIKDLLPISFILNP